MSGDLDVLGHGCPGTWMSRDLSVRDLSVQDLDVHQSSNQQVDKFLWDKPPPPKWRTSAETSNLTRAQRVETS